MQASTARLNTLASLMASGCVVASVGHGGQAIAGPREAMAPVNDNPA